MKNNTTLDKTTHVNIKLKITTLSPVHIGTGDVYEPSNYIIENKKLYKFDEILFYKSLNEVEKQSFNRLDDYMKIIDFYKTKKELAKNIAEFEIDTSKKVQIKYNKQKNDDGSENKNLLEIQTTLKNPNTNTPILSSSTLKGMFETTMKIYCLPEQSSNTVRQNIILSDALCLDGGVEIGYANRKHRNPNKKSKDGITQIIEVIRPFSTFVGSLNSIYSFEDIKKYMRDYHKLRKNSRYEESPNSFIARIGKNVGKEYVVDVANVNNLQNNDGQPLATHFLYDSDALHDEEFGWVKVELISQDEYEKSINQIKSKQRELLNLIGTKRAQIINHFDKLKEEARELAIKKVKQAKEEAQKLEDDRKKREEQLVAMSPIERIFDRFNYDVALIINAMKNNEIENYEEIKKQLAIQLKEIMQKDPKQWTKAKQKALKRKEFIEGISG